MTEPVAPPRTIPHLPALVVAVGAALAGALVTIFGKLDPAAADVAMKLFGGLAAGGFGAHYLALFNDGRRLAADAMPVVEHLVDASHQPPVDVQALAKAIAPDVIAAVEDLVESHLATMPAPIVNHFAAPVHIPEEPPTAPALPKPKPPPLPDTLTLSAADVQKLVAAARAAGVEVPPSLQGVVP